MSSMSRPIRRVLSAAATWCAAVLAIGPACAQTPLGTVFSFQGDLRGSTGPINGTADLRFRLYSAETGGSPVNNQEITVSGAIVAEGRFTALLDFGAAAFLGDARWLEIDTRSPAGNGAYTTLAPRQRLNATPNAAFALTSGAPWRASGADIYFSAGRAGIGTMPSVARLDVEQSSSSQVAINAHNSLSHGIVGTSDQSGYFAGVVGISNAAVQGAGVYGVSSASDGPGVVGEGNTGVSGNAIVPSGVGVRGSCNSGGGYGVVGESSSAGIGVRGQVNGPGGTGVQGSAAIGVHGVGTTYGVLCTGNFGVSGTKAFVIDHPLDPAGKTLRHYCAESPEPMNVYSGSATLDSNGAALVELPAYFAEINRDPRYQLTPIGGPMPSLHISRRVEGNRFSIAGGAPGGEVSWRIEAVRNDLWVRTYGAPSETPKTDSEAGRYHSPELYGHAPTERVNFQQPPKPMTFKGVPVPASARPADHR